MKVNCFKQENLHAVHIKTANSKNLKKQTLFNSELKITKIEPIKACPVSAFLYVISDASPDYDQSINGQGPYNTPSTAHLYNVIFTQDFNRLETRTFST